MNDTLKAAGRIGAELGAAKAENERLRGLLQQVVDCQAEHYGDGCGLHLSMITLAGRIKDALSQQPKPTDTYTAVDMATAAAQGFRDGQAAAEPAPAQDERDAFYAGLYKKSAPMWHRLHELAVSKGYDHVQFAIECAPVYRCDCMGARKVAIDMAGNTIPCECVAAANETEPAPAQDERETVSHDAELYGIGFMVDGVRVSPDRVTIQYGRSAQTAQQPIRLPQRKNLDGLLDPESKRAGRAYNEALEDVELLNAAPIAQTAPQPEQSEELAWKVLQAATDALDRRAAPHAWISQAWNAGSEVITSRRAAKPTQGASEQ